MQHVHAVIGGFHLVWPRADAEALETAAAELVCRVQAPKGRPLVRPPVRITLP